MQLFCYLFSSDRSYSLLLTHDHLAYITVGSNTSKNIQNNPDYNKNMCNNKQELLNYYQDTAR